jgi:hypothetical protein
VRVATLRQCARGREGRENEKADHGSIEWLGELSDSHDRTSLPI